MIALSTGMRFGKNVKKPGYIFVETRVVRNSWKGAVKPLLVVRNHITSWSQFEESLETFWIDLVVQNPMDAEVHLTNFTVTLREESVILPSEAIAQAEVISQIILGAREKQTVILLATRRALRLKAMIDINSDQASGTSYVNRPSSYLRFSVFAAFG